MLVQKTICLSLALAVLAWPSTTTTHKPKPKSHATSPLSSKKSMKAKSAKTKSSKSTKRRGSQSARRSTQQAPTPERYKEIQQALASKGYLHGEPSGKWDADSADALKRFQTDQNLSPDGKINSLSLIALGLGPKRLAAQSHTQAPAETPKTDVSR
jgi:peptidoglycan hydrolase-like protein with peptidoglycan-binding domain